MLLRKFVVSIAARIRVVGGSCCLPLSLAPVNETCATFASDHAELLKSLYPRAALGSLSLRWVNLARGDPFFNRELNAKGWGLKCALFELAGQWNTTAISIEHQMNRFLLLPNHSNSDQPIFCTGSLFRVFSFTSKKIINSFTLLIKWGKCD